MPTIWPLQLLESLAKFLNRASVKIQADTESIREAIAILDEMERKLSPWYGDRRLAV
ncbi:MAG: hypothetical protein HY785_00725 [Oscillatoriophycideae cyanobacterium NC_groundwater_1537_Pr4_S-0.65um_50_18]|nr:hypothetical protein [Oscillatoriophycideae cyanobacterium NC_groundwater_1537_Pr4_S-0.65um_50_18]